MNKVFLQEAHNVIILSITGFFLTGSRDFIIYSRIKNLYYGVFMKYTVVTYPDERLKLVSSPVENIDGELMEFVNDMFAMMYKHDGVGLSAVQIGVMKRLFVMDIPGKGKFVVINPVIIERSKEKSTYEEGCLSLPGISAEVERPKKVVLEYTDLDGERKVLKASGGLLATCIQHEFDHLEGLLFVDKLTPEKRLNKLMEYRKKNSL